mgnify:CR=1 FL=1
MMRKIKYSKFKKWPLWCEAEKAHTCVKNPGITIKIQAWIKRHCGDAWNTLVRNLPSETGAGISDRTYPCAIFLVKPDVTIQDRALGSVIGHTPIFSQYSPLYVVSPQNSECCKAQSILIVVSHAEKRVPCAVVQEWKALLDMQNIGLGMRTAATDACHSKFP